MTQLHQIQLQYIPLEDRALLRIATQAGADGAQETHDPPPGGARGGDDPAPAAGHGAEFRFWVTRRYAGLLLKALSDNVASSAGSTAGTAAASAPENRSAVVAFQREAALARCDFETAYASGSKATPLGEAPVLLARIGVTRLEAGITLLALHPRDGKGIELRLNDTLVHSLIRLIEGAARSGGWALPHSLPVPRVVSGATRPN